MEDYNSADDEDFDPNNAEASMDNDDEVSMDEDGDGDDEGIELSGDEEHAWSDADELELDDDDEDEEGGWFAGNPFGIGAQLEDALGEDAYALGAFCESSSNEGSDPVVEDPTWREDPHLHTFLPNRTYATEDTDDEAGKPPKPLMLTNNIQPPRPFGGRGTRASNVGCFFRTGTNFKELRTDPRPDPVPRTVREAADREALMENAVVRLGVNLGKFSRGRGSICTKTVHHQTADAVNVTVVKRPDGSCVEELTVIFGKFIKIYALPPPPERPEEPLIAPPGPEPSSSSPHPMRMSDSGLPQSVRYARVSGADTDTPDGPGDAWQRPAETITHNYTQLPDGTVKVIPVRMPESQPAVDHLKCTPLCEFTLDFDPYSLARSSDGSVLAVCGDYGAAAVLHYEYTHPTAAALTQVARLCMVHDEQHQQTDSDADEDNEDMGSRHVMGNSVRFGTLLGKERLLVTLQVSMKVGTIAVLDLPDLTPGLDPNRRAESLCCQLYKPEVQAREGVEFKGDQVSATAKPSQPAPYGSVPVHVREPPSPHRLKTTAIGPFATACNFACMSPDGSKLAVCLDQNMLHILHREHGFAPRDATVHEFKAAGRRRSGQGSGLQYCAFSSDNRTLVATSDRSRAAFIIDTESNQVVGRVLSDRAVLPVVFNPFDPKCAVMAESAAHVTAFDCCDLVPTVKRYVAAARDARRRVAPTFAEPAITADTDDPALAPCPAPLPFRSQTLNDAAAAPRPAPPPPAPPRGTPLFRSAAVSEPASNLNLEPAAADRAQQKAAGVSGAAPREESKKRVAPVDITKGEVARLDALERFERAYGPVGRWMHRIRIPRMEKPPTSTAVLVPGTPPSFHFPKQNRRITGLAVAPRSGLVVVGTEHRVLAVELNRVESFTRTGFRFFPPAFKRAARELLLCAREGHFVCRPSPMAREETIQEEEEEACNINDLPDTHVEDLVARLSVPTTRWKAG